LAASTGHSGPSEKGEELGIVNDGDRHHRGLLIRQIARLGENQHAGRYELDLILIKVIQVVSIHEGQGTLLDNVSLIDRIAGQSVPINHG